MNGSKRAQQCAPANTCQFAKLADAGGPAGLCACERFATIDNGSIAIEHAHDRRPTNPFSREDFYLMEAIERYCP
jgi:hypothetical protein